MGSDVYLEAWEASPLAILTLESSGRVHSANPASARIFGLKNDALVGSLLVELAHRLDRGALQSMLDEAQAGRTPSRQEIRFGGPSNGEVVTGLNVAPASAQGRSICVIRDLRQEKTFRPQLLHTERMASMGMIASVVAHELNNALAGALGCLELVSVNDRDTEEMLSTAKREIERAAVLVKDLKDYARVEDGLADEIDIAELLMRAHRLHGVRARSSGIALKLAVSEYLPRLRGSINQLLQALLNLIRNAEDAVATMQLEHPPAIHLKAAAQDDVIHIDVVDHGPGLVRSERGSIFDPFYSTKPAGAGTGLGLTVVQAVSAAHGGRVEILDTPGGGATFRLVLPYAVDLPSEDKQATHADEELDLTNIRVLIAEDEPSIRLALKRGLGSCGAVVVVVEDAQAAIDAVQGEAFDLVLLDLRMPCGGGVRAFREIRDLHPELARRTVFMTGEVAPDMGDIVGQDYALVVEKPFRINQLIRTLMNVIRGR